MAEGAQTMSILLAPLRGVTIRAFRETFAFPIREAGFTAAVAPFIPANPGLRVTDRLLADLLPDAASPASETQVPLIPQVITRHPEAMRELLKGFKDHGFTRADLNAGCPFPMIVRRGRGAGLFRTPEVLEQLLVTGCEVMGPGNFSVKTRLGQANPDELLALMAIYNRYPLAALTVHARTAKQMYAGACDLAAARQIAAESVNPVICNGDLDLAALNDGQGFSGVMVGRSFIRQLGAREDANDLLRDYIARSQKELCGDRPVLGRMKELMTYWAEGSARWRRLWPVVKVCRSVEELLSLVR